MLGAPSHFSSAPVYWIPPWPGTPSCSSLGGTHHPIHIWPFQQSFLVSGLLSSQTFGLLHKSIASARSIPVSWAKCLNPGSVPEVSSLSGPVFLSQTVVWWFLCEMDSCHPRCTAYKRSFRSHISCFIDIVLDKLQWYKTISDMLLQATIIRNYFVKTQTYVASFGPSGLSRIF